MRMNILSTYYEKYELIFSGEDIVTNNLTSKNSHRHSHGERFTPIDNRAAIKSSVPS